MNCERCNKRPATILVTKISNGKKTETRLCSQCAGETEGLYFNTDMSIQNILAGLLDTSLKESQVQATCKQCGLTYQELKKTGKLGCENCYKVFEPYLNATLKQLNGAAIHIGKIPKINKGKLIRQRRIDELNLELQKAIKNEEYEKAATLRDEIRSIGKEGIENE
ncbi:MAG: hypothetical protein K0R15_2632 [Clostridiales bacterium]|jgi:protein arginine kinase activator|nr:hypothetical protein [Clostridiales bacterium]